VFLEPIKAASLQRRLAGILAPYASCATVDNTDGTVAAVRADAPLAGASTQKLLVAAAALATLGAQHRFDTRAVKSAPLRGGTLAGNLVIVGGGDPVLSTSNTPSTGTAPSTSLAALADAIVRTGVTRIDGAIVADDSRYDRERAVPAWKPIYLTEGDVGALGALIVNGGRADNGLASADPALETVQELAALLTERGVQISNGALDPGTQAGDDARTIASVSSPPLGDIVKEMLTVSNDETAELLTREIGVASGGAGTTSAGARAIPAVLSRWGVPVAGVELRDGSGLAPDNRVTCAALAGVLALGGRAGFAPLLDGLAVAGKSGTLTGRFLGTPLAGRLRAKTGHIEGVVGLAGTIGAGVRFAFVANGNFSTATGESLQDQTAQAVAAYLDTPFPADPIPTPR
jgi:D-alanyl-D-alanine carboxypeptidase/D-alanyl-D-alanine-endopeptidase (penicillin-binding protein 4)